MNALDKLEHDSKRILHEPFTFKYCNEGCFVYEWSDGCEIYLIYFKAFNVCAGKNTTIEDVLEQENITYLKVVSFCAFTYEKEKETIYINL